MGGGGTQPCPARTSGSQALMLSFAKTLKRQRCFLFLPPPPPPRSPSNARPAPVSRLQVQQCQIPPAPLPLSDQAVGPDRPHPRAASAQVSQHGAVAQGRGPIFPPSLMLRGGDGQSAQLSAGKGVDCFLWPWGWQEECYGAREGCCGGQWGACCPAADALHPPPSLQPPPPPIPGPSSPTSASSTTTTLRRRCICP